jgi:hypothetical protein
MGPLNFMTSPERTYLGMFKLNSMMKRSSSLGLTTSTTYLACIVDASPASCAIAARKFARPTPPEGAIPSALEINKRYYIRENMLAWPPERQRHPSWTMPLAKAPCGLAPLVHCTRFVLWVTCPCSTS